MERDLTISEIDYVHGLEKLAEFLRDNPDLIPDMDEHTFRKYIYKNPSLFGKLGLQMGSPLTKKTDQNYMEVKRQFGPHTLMLFTSREETCVAKKVTKEVEVIEWECKSLHELAKGEA